MSDEHLQDDQSHYEISLTGGQAFVAFVLLLLSLGASFAFGLMIGKGQADSRLVVQREPSIVTEANVMAKPATAGEIVELVPEATTTATDTATLTDTTATGPAVIEEATMTDTTASTAVAMEAAAATPAAAPPAAEQRPADVKPTPAPEKAPAVPYYAQLLSTGDQKTAETLAAKLIDNGFTSAYVERGSNAKGPVYRVRVKFSSEADARAAEARLETFSKDVWITK